MASLRQQKKKWMPLTTVRRRKPEGYGYRGAAQDEARTKRIDEMVGCVRPSALRHRLKRQESNAVQRGEKRALSDARKRRGVRGKVGVA